MFIAPGHQSGRSRVWVKIPRKFSVVCELELTLAANMKRKHTATLKH